jgi:hypothetical protein
MCDPGDDKQKVLFIMGSPGDRQFRGKDEAWQYGKTGAGFGYRDFPIIWFYDGKGNSQSYFKFQNLKFQRKRATRWPPALQPISNRSAGKTLPIGRLKFGTGSEPQRVNMN